jgi:hypothetical protein
MTVNRLLIAAVLSSLLVSCSPHSTTQLNRLAEDYRLPPPNPVTVINSAHWKYRTAVEGFRPTYITLIKAETTESGLTQFLNSISNRIVLVDVPYAPTFRPDLEERFPWWDAHVHPSHRYFQLRQGQEDVDAAVLKTYIVTNATGVLLYFYNYHR